MRGLIFKTKQWKEKKRNSQVVGYFWISIKAYSNFSYKWEGRNERKIIRRSQSLGDFDLYQCTLKRKKNHVNAAKKSRLLSWNWIYKIKKWIKKCKNQVSILTAYKSAH